MSTSSIHSPLKKPLLQYQSSVLLFASSFLLTLLALCFAFLSKSALAFTPFTFRILFLEENYLILFSLLTFYLVYAAFASYRAFFVKPFWMLPLHLFYLADFIVSFFPGEHALSGGDYVTSILIPSLFLLLAVTQYALYARLLWIEKRINKNRK